MVGKILDTHLLATLTRAVYANSPSQWVKSVITRYFFRTPYRPYWYGMGASFETVLLYVGLKLHREERIAPVDTLRSNKMVFVINHTY